MQVSELANRYARAAFDLAKQNSQQDKIFAELRALALVFEKDAAIEEFLRSPLVRAEERESTLKKVLADKGLSDLTLAFILLLANKNRLYLFAEVLEAMKTQADEAHGVTRGQVRSAEVLSPEDRKRIEEIVSKFTKKQVILNYKEDPAVIGGLIAEVGSYTFDDTLTSHLRRLKDEMSRRVQ